MQCGNGTSCLIISKYRDAFPTLDLELEGALYHLEEVFCTLIEVKHRYLLVATPRIDFAGHQQDRAQFA